MKKYNAVNSKWLLFGLVLPILLFFLSYNAVFAYFTASAGEKYVSTKTAIVKIGFKADENGNYATHEVISSSTTNSASKLVPGDTLKANATVINNGNVSVYCIINFKISVIKKSSEEEIISNDFYTFTSSGGELTSPLELKDTYTTEQACVISPNGEVSVYVNTDFAGSKYDNSYKDATIEYTYTAYAIQTSGLTATTAISEILTNLLNGGNRITKISGNSIQNGTPTPESPVEIQSVGEKTINSLNLEKNSNSVNGITFTVNADKTITMNGTSTADIVTNISVDNGFLESDNSVYTLCGCFGGSSDTYYMQSQNGYRDTGNGTKVSYPVDKNKIRLYVKSGVYLNNVTIYPMLIEGDYVGNIPAYEPYGYKIPVEINGEITNIYLDEPLRKVGDYADYIDLQNGKVVRNVGTINFDGSEDEQWYTWGVNNLTEGITGFYIYYMHLGLEDGSKQIRDGLSNILLYNDDVWGGRNEGCENNTSESGYITMCVRNSLLNDVTSSENAIASFRNLISSTGVEYNYVLENIIEESIDLPEIFDEPITEYSILTTIQPDITVKYLVK